MVIQWNVNISLSKMRNYSNLQLYSDKTKIVIIDNTDEDQPPILEYFARQALC